MVKDAGVTRGALYYRFTDKHDLVRLVCHKLQNNNAKKIGRAINQASDFFAMAWTDAILSGIRKLERRKDSRFPRVSANDVGSANRS